MPLNSNNDTVTVRTFPREIEAEMARGHLEAQGITCTVLKNDLGGLHPLRNRIYGFRLVVFRADRQRAEETLQAMGI